MMTKMSEIVSTPMFTNRPIQILSPQLANQIAAGEVVERPASVVKELVENSIDANATQIHIEIDQGGQKRILIRDNGDGISKEQLTLALSRHATSKIANIDDLEHITSMGFRGEALASISSVSRLTLTSKPKRQSEAWQAVAEGQQMVVEITPAAHPDGTSIEVVDLFFNTPARRKFLRTGKTEFQHIENIVKRIALTRPDIQFVLVHNQKVCYRFASVTSLPKRIEQVCGKKMLEQCVQVEYQYEGITLQGWCSKLGLGVANRDYQYTFVNDRMMKDKLLSHALRQVYEDTLGPQSFAAYVLYLKMPPEQLDVNVHPAKHEVRFHQARQIHDLVFKAVSDALGQGLNSDHNCQPTHDYIMPLITEDKDQNVSASQQTGFGKTYKAGGHGYQSNSPSRGQICASHEFYQSVNDTSLRNIGNVAPNNSDETDTKSYQSEAQDESHVSADHACLYNAPYLVFSTSNKLTILHIKHLLRLLIEQGLKLSTLAQPLLMPVSINKPDAFFHSVNSDQIKSQVVNLKNPFHFINQFHFLIEQSHKKVLLKQVPSELRQLPWANIFPHINFSTLSDKHHSEEINEWLSGEIGQAWCHCLLHQNQGISSSMLKTWLSKIEATSLRLALTKYAKILELHEWMQHEQ